MTSQARRGAPMGAKESISELLLDTPFPLLPSVSGDQPPFSQGPARCCFLVHILAIQ